MILETVKRKTASGNVNFHHLECPVCGKRFYRDVRNYNRNAYKDRCCFKCDRAFISMHGFDFQEAYNKDFSGWKPYEEPVLDLSEMTVKTYSNKRKRKAMAKQQQFFKEILCGY